MRWILMTMYKQHKSAVESYWLHRSLADCGRHMFRLYNNALTTVRAHGKFDLFITMTCNPNWPEIKNNMGPAEFVIDRPDLCASVFNK